MVGDFPETAVHLSAENLPIAAPPSVDGLFDVADQQDGRFIVLCYGIFQQRDEIAPLLLRSVLKFVDHEVREGVPRFFVDKRRVVAAD